MKFILHSILTLKKAITGLLLMLCLYRWSTVTASALTYRSLNNNENGDRTKVLPSELASPTIREKKHFPSLLFLTQGNKALNFQIQELEEKLQFAYAETEFFRKAYQQLRLQNEALGIDALTVNEKKMQERLVEALQEGYQAEKQRRILLNTLYQVVAEGVKLLQQLKKQKSDYQNTFEIAIHQAEAILSVQQNDFIHQGKNLNDGKVVSVNPELASVIINIGRNQKVRSGMPFSVLRKNHLVGKIQAFLVQDQFSVALIESKKEQDLDRPEIHVGDQIKVWAKK